MRRIVFVLLLAFAGLWAWRDAGLAGHRVLSTSNIERDVCVAATDSGVFLTFGRGDYWDQIYDYGHHPDLTVAVRFTGYDPRDIYLAWGWGSRSDGLWHSADTGRTWSVLHYQLFANLVEADPSDQAVIFTGSDTLDSGLWRSTDGGTNWERRDAGLPSSNVRAVWLCGDGQTVYAAPNGRGLYRSTDLGQSWAFAGPDSGLDVMDVCATDYWPDDLLLVGRGEGTSGVWHTSDSGATWRRELAVENGTCVRLPYAGFLGDSGVYRRLWGDSTWVPDGSHLRSRMVRTMSSDGPGWAFGYLGTDDGAWHWDWTPAVEEGATRPEPVAVALPSVVSAASAVLPQDVRVIDAQGRDVTAAASTLGSGVYFIRSATGDRQAAIARVVLAR